MGRTPDSGWRPEEPQLDEPTVASCGGRQTAVVELRGPAKRCADGHRLMVGRPAASYRLRSSAAITRAAIAVPDTLRWMPSAARTRT